MKLLVIEDEPRTAGYLRKGLSEQGFSVDAAQDGDTGLRLASQGDYDLVILDIMLPGRDGWSVLTAMREAERHTPVLMLTARDAVADRVRGLELGADDYLVKPFSFAELVARIRTVLRRVPQRHPDTIRVADLEIDLLHHRATRGGQILDLTPTEFRLLSLFMRRCGEVLSRTMIQSQVWDINFDSDTNVVDVHVRRLRTKVDEPFAVKLIHTVRGMGYVLEQRP